MNENLKISIIVPMYNAEEFIAEAIESALNQTYHHIELLLINDGSSDSTGNICREYAEKSEKIKYFEKSNSGVSDTRNFGIGHASGDYIIFMDADDSIPQNAVESFVLELSECDYDSVFAGHRNVYDKTSVNRLMRLPNGIYVYEDLKHKLLDDGTMTGILFGSVCGACYRTAFLKEKQLRFRSEVKVNEDGLFNIELIHSCDKVKVIDNIVYNYRQWKNSKKIPLKRDKRFETSEPTIAQVIESFNEREIYDVQLKRRRVSVAFWNAVRIMNSETGHKNNIGYLRDLFSENNLDYSCLDYEKMSKVKKMLCYFMKRKMTKCFYIAVKYVSPLLAGVIRR